MILSRRLLPLLGLLCCLPLLPTALSAEPEIRSLDELLELVKQGRIQQSRENREREQRFLQQKSRQCRLHQAVLVPLGVLFDEAPHGGVQVSGQRCLEAHHQLLSIPLAAILAGGGEENRNRRHGAAGRWTH